MSAIAYDELFNRIGRIGHVVYLLDGDQAVLPAAITDLIDNYEGTTDNDLIGTIDTNQNAIIRSVCAPVMTNLAPLASTTMLRMVSASVPSIRSTSAALVELIRQMRVDSQSVKACTVSVTPTALTTNVGNGVLVTSTKRGDGLVQENLFAETLRLACSNDSYTGSATVGQEGFILQSKANTASIWDYDYPQGSSANVSASAISATVDASSSGGNLLTNSDFESWTGSPAALDNWTLQTGTWGTDIDRSTTMNQGSYALEFLAGTGVNTAIYQQFNVSTGTNGIVAANTSYPVNVWMRKLSGTISAGVLTIELVDSTSTVINDQQGVANSTTITLTTLTTAYVAHNVVFRLPNNPTTVRLRFRMSTALVGGNVLLDDAAMAPFAASYPGGFGFALFSGAIPFVAGDGWDITTANNRGGATYLASFQPLFDRLFNMRQLNLLLPSNASPTQVDTKIST